MSAKGKSTAEEQTKLTVSMETEGTQPASDPPDDELNSAETPSTWAEQDETHGLSNATPIPDAIRRLYKNGIRFKKVPSSVWGLEGEHNRLHKSLSVYFSVDTLCTSQDILEGFAKAMFRH